jgi:nickel-dependent lactate racemase
LSVVPTRSVKLIKIARLFKKLYFPKTPGKEKVFLEIAKTLDLKFWAETSKRKILDNLDDPLIEQFITANKEDAKIHVIPNGQISFKVIHFDW